MRVRVHLQLTNGGALVAKFEYRPLEHKTLVMSNVKYFGSNDLTQGDVTTAFKACAQTLKATIYSAMALYLSNLSADLFGKPTQNNPVIIPLVD